MNAASGLSTRHRELDRPLDHEAVYYASQRCHWLPAWRDEETREEVWANRRSSLVRPMRLYS